MIIYLIFFIFVLLFARDFKKAIIIYAPFKFVFSYGLLSHVGKFELDTLFTMILFIAWLLQGKKRNWADYPLKGAMMLVGIGVLAHSLNPFFSITVLADGFSPYVYLIMFFYALKTEQDMRLFVKVLSIYVILLNVNALTELMGYNVIGHALVSAMTPTIYWAEDVVVRGIFVRLHSFVPHSIGYGVENMVFFSFYLMLYLYGERFITKKKSIILMFVSLAGIYLSGSRSPLLGGIIMLLPLLANKRMLNAKNMTFFIFAALIISSFAGGYIMTMYDSLATDKDTDLGGASSWDMRFGQLEYSIYYWMKNFWFGNGHTFDIFQGGTQYSSIFGAESVWFPLMMKQGIVGMVAYLSVTINACASAVKTKHKSLCICLMLGWLVIDSATNLPGLSILLPLYFYVIYYKWNKLIPYNYAINNNPSI